MPSVLVLIYATSRLRRGDPARNTAIAARAGLVVMTFACAAMLFTPVVKTMQDRAVDLDLLHTVRHSLDGQVMFAQMVGNLLLLSWLAFLLPLAFRPIRPGWAVVITLGASIGVEVLQYALAVGRVSSLSDVFFNTLGGLAGALLATPVRARFIDRPRALRPATGCGSVPY